MKLVFDPIKRATNIAKHDGRDFAALDLAFFERSEIYPARNGRFTAVGEFEDEVITVVFSLLGNEALSVISMRRASKKERRRQNEIAL